MIIRLLPQRLFRLQGHRIDGSRLYAVQWVLGIFGILWAILVGCFITLGGANHLTGELYQPLIATFGNYQIIGAVSIVGGVIGVIGLGLDMRAVSIASAAICTLWNGLMATWIIPANWTVAGGGNILGLYALFVTISYLLRIILLLAAPSDDAMKLR